MGPLSSRAISSAVPAGTAGGRSRYLWEVLGTLWPSPTRVARCGRWHRGAPDGHHATEFVIVPSERRAVLLLPRRPRRVAAAALRNYKASATTWDRRKLDTLALGARLGLTDVLPDRVRIERATTGDDLTGYLNAALGRDIVVSLHIGPPRANRKPVLQALAPDGTAVGFVKVGVDPLTCDLVRAEAAALAFLQDTPLTKVRAPRLLWHGQWRGHEVLVQQAFPRGRRARDLAQLAGAMAELAAVRGTTVMPAAISPYWRNLRPRVRALGQRGAAAALLQALDHAEAAAGATALRFGSWHGDWAPWNMTFSQGRALVWDWERFEADVPVGYDAVHYALQQAVRDGMADEPAAEDVLSRAPEIVAPLGVDPAVARLVATLYLIEIGTRYLRDGQAEAGARLGRVDRWLLPVLARHLHDGKPSQGGAEPVSRYVQKPGNGTAHLSGRSGKEIISTVAERRRCITATGLRKGMVALSALAAILGSGCSSPSGNTQSHHGSTAQFSAEPTSLGSANLVSYADSDFETGIGDWAPVSNATLSTDTSISFLHRTSLKDVLGAAGDSSFELGDRRIDVSAGDQYRVGAYFDVPAGSGQSVAFGVQAYDSAGRPLGQTYGSPVSINGTGGWQYASDVITMPTAAAYVADSPEVTYSGGRAGEAVHMDEVQFSPYRAAMLIGADAGASGAIASWMTANDTLGSLQLDKIFYRRALPPSYSGSTCAGLPEDVMCLVAYKTPTTNVASFVSSIPADRAVVMIFHQEPEGDFRSGADYVAQFEAQSTLIRGAAGDAPNVFVADDASTYQYQPGHEGADCSYIPPPASTDFYLADHYQPSPNGHAMPNGQHSDQWTTWLNCVQPTHKPIGLAEYGLGTCGARGNTTRTQSLLADNSYLMGLPAVIQAPVLTWNYWWVNGSTAGSCTDWQFNDAVTSAWRSVQAGQ